MGNIYAVAGRPLSGKTQYLLRLNKQMGASSLYVSAMDYRDFAELVNVLSRKIMDSDTISTVSIDDFESKLIEDWNIMVNEEEYRKALQVIAGLADNYDLDIYFAVGMKREADRENQLYCSEKHLRAEAICKEVDGVVFLKN